MAEITEIVESLVTPIVDEKGYELVDVEYIKEKSTRYLRIYVNKSGGIDIEEVAQVSEQLSEKLDELNPDPFPEPYMLEVSSPGVERPIKKEKDWESAIGEYINVSLYRAFEGEKVYEGFLISKDESFVTLEIKIKTQRKQLSIPTYIVAKARFAIEF